MMTPATIAQAVERSGEDRPERVAYVRLLGDGLTERITFGQVWSSVRLAAQGMIASGLAPNRRVALIGENGPEWAIGYLSVVSAGCVVVPLDTQLGLSELRHVLVQSRASAVFATERYLDDLLEATDTHPDVRVYSLGAGREGVPAFEQFVASGTGGSLPAVAPDDTAALLFTSGTTGTSRGVVLSHRNIMSDVDGMCEAFPELSSDDVFLSVLPMHHVYEASAGFLKPLTLGITVAFARSLKSRELLADMQTVRPTVMLGVPLLFDKLIEGIMRGVRRAPPHRRALVRTIRALDRAVCRTTGANPSRVLLKGLRRKAGLERLRVFISGGAALDPRLSSVYASFGIRLLQGYGLTETSPVIAVNPLSKTKPETVGPALPGCSIRIADANEDGVGEIEVIGPMVTPGYEDDPEANERSFTPDGWFRTGDLGSLDGEGYLTIRGRKKSIIVTRAGKNVYPEEVELHLDRMPSVRESLVLGAPTGGGGEEVVAIVVPDFEHIDSLSESRGVPFTPSEIEALVQRDVRAACDGIAPFKRVKRFSIREEEFPKTTTCKIKRYLFSGRQVSVNRTNDTRGGSDGI
jgi:long-chain acyl-CoA synthetase